MDLIRDIHAAENGLTALLYQAHLDGQARNQARRQQSEDNAVNAVDRLGQALLASRRREAALRREIAALQSQLQTERARPRAPAAVNWGTGLSARRA